MKRFLLAAIFSFFSFLTFAEEISFPFKNISVPIEWNEKWFGEKSSFEYNHNLARIACYLSDVSYSGVKENPSENNLVSAYKKLGVTEKNIETHYDINYKDAMWGNDQCAFSIASKKINSSHGEQNLVFVVIRGTPFNANEWLSNLNINDTNKTEESIHKGFARAANIVHTALISYMLRHRIDPTDSFLFMTGHSRGAAVSNMLSAILLEDNFFKPQNIYTYTFASPNVTTSSDTDSEKYGFIWNIVNPEDIVPTVPINRGKWAFKKYGHTLAFSNLTNTLPSVYSDDYVPRINEIYKEISGREYKPFTTGPFVPIVVTKLIEYLTGDVELYYTGFFDVHAQAVKMMHKVFPENKILNNDAETSGTFEETEEDKSDKKQGKVGSWIVRWLNNRSNGLLDYVKLALADMHSNHVYLSYMLALDENEIFSSLDYSIVTVKGYEEFAVLDSQGNIMARVNEGKIIYADVKFPVILCPTIGKDVIVGCPSKLDFSIVVTDEALIPTPAAVTVEFFDAAGVYKNSSEVKKAYINFMRVYKFDIGNASLRNNGIDFDVMNYSEGMKIVKRAKLRPKLDFHIYPEVYMNNDFKVGMGLHAGSSLIYGSIMTVPSNFKMGERGEFSLGIGNQQTLYSQIKMENEVFAKFVWTGNDDKFALIPEWRTSISFKLLGRMRFFCAGVFDFNIDDFNDVAFENKKRVPSLHTFELGDSVKVSPSLQFGLRF